jgi:hypothetical protein
MPDLARLRRLVKYSWLAVAAAAVVVGWIFFSRWQQDRDMRQRALEKQREEDRRVVEMLGGNRFEILHLYAVPGVIRPGEAAQVCYGVSNAKTVRLEPQSSPVWPSFSRCVDVSPAKDTTYTLTIEDRAGQTKTATVTVQVR